MRSSGTFKNTDQPRCKTKPPRSGNGHHRMHVVEGVPRLANSSSPRDGQALPSIPDVNAIHLEPPQQSTRIQQFHDHGRRRSSYTGVVQLEHSIPVPQVAIVESLVPRNMYRQATLDPVTRMGQQPLLALIDSVRHFKDVRYRMNSPRVVLVPLHRATTHVERLGIIPHFFETKGIHAPVVALHRRSLLDLG